MAKLASTRIYGSLTVDNDTKLNGGATIGGYLGLNGNFWTNGVFQSTITGTAPLIVASTTEIANLRSATATKLASSRLFTITDNDATNSQAAATSFDGAAAYTIKLPATIKASITGNVSGSSGSCTGNAATATALANARLFTITDNDGTNSQAAATSFSGSAAYTIKLPATIKASITGNVSGSSGSCTGNAATATLAYPRVTAGRTDAAFYSVPWHSGNALYSATNVQIQSSTGTLKATALEASSIVASSIKVLTNDVWHKGNLTLTLSGTTLTITKV